MLSDVKRRGIWYNFGHIVRPFGLYFSTLVYLSVLLSCHFHIYPDGKGL